LKKYNGKLKMKVQNPKIPPDGERGDSQSGSARTPFPPRLRIIFIGLPFLFKAFRFFDNKKTDRIHRPVRLILF
jgi:hypothetical protein